MLGPKGHVRVGAKSHVYHLAVLPFALASKQFCQRCRIKPFEKPSRLRRPYTMNELCYRTTVLQILAVCWAQPKAYEYIIVPDGSSRSPVAALSQGMLLGCGTVEGERNEESHGEICMSKVSDESFRNRRLRKTPYKPW